MMMSLGMFVFQMDSLPYQELQRKVSWRHPSNGRVGLRPGSQFAGLGDETITLSGVLVPPFTGGEKALHQLEAMANKGEQWSLIEGSGRVYGFFVIEGLSEGKTLFFSDGTARRIEFTIDLKRVGDDQLNNVATLLQG